MMIMKSDKMAVYLNKWLTDNDRAARWLSRRAGVSHTVVTDMTKGHVPKIDYLVAVEKAMGVEPGDLVCLAAQIEERSGIKRSILSTFTHGWRNLSPDLQDRTAEVFSRMAPDEWMAWLMRIIGPEPDASVSDDDGHPPGEAPPPPLQEKGGKRNKAQLQRRAKGTS